MRRQRRRSLPRRVPPCSAMTTTTIEWSNYLSILKANTRKEIELATPLIETRTMYSDKELFLNECSPCPSYLKPQDSFSPTNNV
mmetsp:Transcript_28027/g.66794  ORF Transcript_28027/g.66794 Transcript_28027/m.66794 type:complete len:84 (-) Transcript_28027:70-321(-)